MFSTSEQFARVAHGWFDNQAALVDHCVHALFDAGTQAAETHAETIRTLFASTTVAARQWMGAGGAYNWLHLAAHQPHLGWTSTTALPVARGISSAPALQWRLD